MLNQIKNTASFILNKTICRPEVGIILGTGLGGLADSIENKEEIPYRDIPGFPVSTVEGHAGKLIFGELSGVKVAAMQGRFHYYEGYTPQEVVFPVRVMKYLGIKTLIVSNASGGVNPDFRTGDIMVITDHINMIPNPLIGRNINELGPRFPDMSEPYSRELIEKARTVAAANDIKLQFGCYLGLTGPTFETQKEYGFYRTAGADTVGMSTTPEVIAARHMDIPVFGMSVITNMGIEGMKSTHEEVQAEGIKAQARLKVLIKEMLKILNK